MSTTSAERIESLTETIAVLRIAEERFPDAHMDGAKVVSDAVTLDNADVVLAEEVPLFGDRKTIAFRLGVRVAEDLVVYETDRMRTRYASAVLHRLMADPVGKAALLGAMKGA